MVRFERKHVLAILSRDVGTKEVALGGGWLWNLEEQERHVAAIGTWRVAIIARGREHRPVPIMRTRVGYRLPATMKIRPIHRAAGPDLPPFSSRVYRAGLWARAASGTLFRGHILAI